MFSDHKGPKNINYTRVKLIKCVKRACKSTIGVTCELFVSQYTEHSTLVISKSKALSELLRDIRISTYQIGTTEEKINRQTTFNK